jgi:hypothetical protein
MIISIKEMVFTKEKAGQASDVGFTIVPLIDTKGFFYTGTYQIPLFKKDITKSVAEDIQKDEPWRRLIEFMELKDPKTKKRLIELLQPVSVIVRLKDNYYQNLYETPYDTQRMKYYMLPDTLLDKYMYDEKAQIRLEKTRRMKEILPKGAIGLEFNELLRRTMGMAYNVQFEEEEAAGSEKSKKDDGEDDN